MTKEELIQFLKDNLKLEIKENRPMYYSDVVHYTVKLKLGEEVISEDYITGN